MKFDSFTSEELKRLNIAIEKERYRRENPTILYELSKCFWPVILFVLIIGGLMYMANQTAQKGYFDLQVSCSPFPEPEWFDDIKRKEMQETSSDDTPYTGNVSTGGAFGGLSGGSGMGGL